MKTTDHWKDNPAWTQGRRHLATFLVFGNEPSFVKAAKKVQADLAGAPVAICPIQSLHQTVQGAGWNDELTLQEVQSVKKELLRAAGEISAFKLGINSVKYESDAIWLTLEPSDLLINLRQKFHEAISIALGRRTSGEPNDIFPHMTVAYCNKEADASQLIAVAQKYKSLQVKPVQVNSIELIWLRREASCYSWDVIESLPFKK